MTTRFFTDRTLEDFHKNFASQPGWLSRLCETFLLSEADESYLHWFDDYDGDLQKRVVLVEQEFEEGLATQLLRVTDHINAIEREADKYKGEERFLFVGLSELDELISKRWKLRNALLAQCLPSSERRIADTEIDRARLVPLYRIIPNLPRNRFILCPYHKEKTPSFKVFERGYCFGCGVSVDSIRWMMDHFSYSFIQAVQALNGK